MASEQQQLRAGIAALDAQRPLLGDAVVDSMLAPARARLAAVEAALAAEPDPDPEHAPPLTQATILCLDVVGSSTLSQRLDPDQISALTAGARARGAEVVTAHKGRVLPHAGDNLLAAFGAEDPREDDTERAVRCGLALLDLGRSLRAEVLTAHGQPGFDVRVGIHTGGVQWGDGTARGLAVHVAERMAQTAPPGALRISHDTYAQVRGLFEVDVEPAMTLQGVDEPLVSYLVVRAKPRSFRIGTRGIEGMATRMIGRDGEFDALQGAFKRLFADRTYAAVTVVADAGLGKSRLLYEFEAWSEARPETFFIFRGRASPQTRGQPFGLLRDILAWRFQIADDDSVETARSKMEQGIIPLFLHDDGPELAQAHTHVLGHLIGIEWRESRHLRGILDDPKQIRHRAFHAAAQMFRRVSATQAYPIVLQLEDLHWADNESLDFLAHLGEVNRDMPMLVVAVTRPALYERRADWQGAGAAHQRVDLRPLDRRLGRLLADELLKKLPEIPAALRELITGGAEGNPFHMEELVKLFIDQGAIATGNTASDPWTVRPDKLLTLTVQHTLTGVLQARLDDLPPNERRALQAASVIGPVFWDETLYAIDAQARDALPALVARELAMPRTDATPDGLREYALRHQILQQVTYDTLPTRERRELHAKAASWLAGLKGPRANDFLAATAEHYERAGDTVNAVEFHARAAEHARERFGHDAVLGHVGRAMALLDSPASPPPDAASRAALRWRLLRVREQTLSLQGHREAQAADIEAMAQTAEALDDDARRAHAAWRRSDFALRAADGPASMQAAREAMQWAERARDDGLRLHALRQLAQAQVSLGEVAAGQALALQGLADARSRGLRANELTLLHTLTLAAERQGQLVSGLELLRQTHAITREVGDRRVEALTLLELGRTLLCVGDLVQARRALSEALRLLRAHGDRAIEGSTLSALSTVALWQSEDARALALARSAVDLTVTTPAQDAEIAARLGLGLAELALGRPAAASETFVLTRERARAIGHAGVHAATAGAARAALALGDGASARREVDTLLARATAGAAWGGEHERWIELTCYLVLVDAGDARAVDWLSRAHDAVQARAATLADAALRQSFLQHIPAHRDILLAWAARADVALSPTGTA